ncbi:hypothetical protein [Streptomyces sp. NPDC008125]|uniref:hypothetical protein n=1 Tax=Streptomyces sp. NPDC008125 TaxID=3364811 RepID=UPI0036E0CBDB
MEYADGTTHSGSPGQLDEVRGITAPANLKDDQACADPADTHGPVQQIAATTKASHTARDRAAPHLLTVRLKQLHEQATTVRRSGQAGAGSWTGRLPELAARALDGDTAGRCSRDGRVGAERGRPRAAGP